MKKLPLSLILAVVPSAASTGHGQSTVALENGAAKHTFLYNTSTREFWLSRSEPKPIQGGKGVSFLQAPQWHLELHVDANAPCWAGTGGSAGDRFAIEATPTTMGGTLIVTHAVLPTSQQVVLATWTGSIPVHPAIPTLPCGPTFDAFVEVSLQARWAISTAAGAEGHASATVVAEILNKTTTPYRIARVRFPHLEVLNLSTSGEDFLATGRNGGFLYKDPIQYVDPHSAQPLRLSFSYPMSLSAYPVPFASDVDPGGYAVPVLAYYDKGSAMKNCLYLANDDLKGHVKIIGIGRDPVAGPQGQGSLIFEVTQFPTGNVYQVQRYAAPYAVHVAALQGDWVDAAKKYKKVYTSDPIRYLGPAASPLNTRISQPLKENPHYGFLDPHSNMLALGVTNLALMGYCPENFAVGDLLNPSAVPGSAADCLDYFAGLIGLPFPMVSFNRFIVDPPSEASLNGGTNGYTPSTSSSMTAVHKLIADAEIAGHHVALHGLTEKLYTFGDMTDPSALDNCFSCAAGSYCCAIDPDLRQMSWESSGTSVYDYPTGGPCGSISCELGSGFICPLAIADTSLSVPMVSCSTGTNPNGDTWSQWTRDFLVTVLQTIGKTGATTVPATGGLIITAPAPFVGGCLSKNHAHTAGFGSWFSDAGADFMSDIRSAVASDMPILLEGSSGFWSPYVTVQNPWSVDTARDPYNMLDESTLIAPFETLNWYYDAPIYKIPFMQMIADDVRYATQYGETRTCALPFVANDFVTPYMVSGCGGPPQSYDSAYFEGFPAVTGAIGAWQQAKRVLVHQSSVIFYNLWMYPPSELRKPEVQYTIEDFAASDMLEFYAGLVHFLRAPDPDGKPLMEYFAGSLERNVEVQITTPLVQEKFRIDEVTIDQHFPKLGDLLEQTQPGGSLDPCTASFPAEDIDFEKYRPGNNVAYHHGRSGYLFFPVAPEEEGTESWLPHGMYKHFSGFRYALLICNPWGVRHVPTGTNPATAPKMNPFTFDYSGAAPVSNSYSYSFEVDPAKYGFPAGFAYQYSVRTYDDTGAILSTTPWVLVSGGGPVTVTGTLNPSEFAACVFK